MNLWIVHQNATLPSQNGLLRPYSLARTLLRRGHRVVIVASGFNHKARTQLLAPGERQRRESHDGVDFLWLRSPGYAGNSARRLWNMMHFAGQIWRLSPTVDLPPPDVILGSSPSPFAALAAQQLAVRYRVPFVLEVRDLWPQTLIDVGNFSAWHPVVGLMLWVERRLYRSADRIVSLLPNAAAHMVAKGAEADRIAYVPNGVDLGRVPPPRPPDDDGILTVMYAGAHGIANGMDVLLDAAALLHKEPGAGHIRLKFVGDGAEKPRLEKRAAAAGLTNVEFAPLVPSDRVYDVMAEADVFIVNVRALPLYRHGVSLNKFFDYMAMARPTVVAISAFNNPIADADAGLVVPGDDAAAIAEAVIRMAEMSPTERWQMGLRGRRYVEEHHDFAVLGAKLETVLQTVLQREPRIADTPSALSGATRGSDQ